MGRIYVTAYIALLLWLPISFIGISVLRPTLACASLMLGAVMFLPNGAVFDMPGMPPIGKEAMASLGLLLACVLRYPALIARARPGRGLEWLVVVAVLGGLGTVLTNRDTLVYGTTVLYPLGLYDSLSDGIRDLLRFALPFFLGRAFFRRPSDLKDLLLVLSGAGLIYSLFILYELRMAPTLHRDLYGSFSHAFSQHVRWGGYRPMVFMSTGLAIALFVSNTVVASALLARARVRVFRLPATLVTVYLFAVLVLCKSYAAISYALVGAPLAFLMRARVQTLVASALATLVFSYPLLRSADLFPTDTLLEVASALSEERADSLEFRFDNEDLLAAKANDRPIFGWGGFRRSRVFDDVTGRDVSITDGAWIILLGERGLVGFAALFGLLLVPVFQAGRAQRRVASERERLLLSGSALLVALCAIDLLPNGMFTNLIFFLSGCLAGAAAGAGRGSRRRSRSSGPTQADQASGGGEKVAVSASSTPSGGVQRSVSDSLRVLNPSGR